jgi:hypothetical protein
MKDAVTVLEPPGLPRWLGLRRGLAAGPFHRSAGFLGQTWSWGADAEMVRVGSSPALMACVVVVEKVADLGLVD